MQHENFNDLLAFLIVARERSFTRAAAKLRVSQSALSHTIRGLETRLNIRLLTRTTRSVSPTEAGEQLLHTLTPHFEAIETQIAALSELRDKPAGTIRINADEHSANSIICPKLTAFLDEYPDITVEVTIDNGTIDIVKQQYDAGVRLGELIEKDMIAVPIAPPMRMVVAGSPSYFAKYPIPEVPQDLLEHNCIGIRLVGQGRIYAWEFEKEGLEQKIQVKGQFIFNQTSPRLNAALVGAGLVYGPQDIVQPYVNKGELILVLEDWCPYFAGYHLYYPNRRHSSIAFKLLVDTLRYRDENNFN